MITSRTNEKIKYIASLAKSAEERNKAGLYIVEGPRMVMEIPDGEIRELYVSENYKGELPVVKSAQDKQSGADSGDAMREIPIYKVSAEVFEKISSTKNPQGILAIVRMPQYSLEDIVGKEGPLLVVEKIQDPGNLGTMLRSGEAAGIAGIIVDKTTADMFNPKVIRSTMGSIFRVPFLNMDLEEAIDALKKSGYTIYAAHLSGDDVFTSKAAKKAAYLIGNEGAGLSDEISALSDVLIKIPMEGRVESLNAAISATLLAYEWHRQHRS